MAKSHLTPLSRKMESLTPGSEGRVHACHTLVEGAISLVSQSLVHPDSRRIMLVDVERDGAKAHFQQRGSDGAGDARGQPAPAAGAQGGDAANPAHALRGRDERGSRRG